MNSIQSLYLVAVALCLFSTLLLNGRAQRTGEPVSLFVAFLALEALCFLFELLIAHPTAPLKALWLGLLMATSLLIAPCLWLAIRESVEGKRQPIFSLRWPDRAAIVVGIVLTLPLIETAHFGPDFHNPGRTAPTFFEPLIHETMLLCIGIFAVQVPYYVWRCRELLMRNGALARSSGRPQSWLQVPLVIVCTTWLLGVLRTLTGALTDGNAGVFAAAAIIDIAVTIGCVYLIVNRITSAAQATTASDPSQTAEPCSGPPKYAKSQLDISVRTRILRKLERALEGSELYRDSRLSLGTLSKHLNESEHYVSQVINQALGTTFYDLVNTRRIEHAQRLLASTPDANVLEVALSVGFNAKSTFNSAFRRHTGMTPSAFRAAASQRQAIDTP